LSKTSARSPPSLSARNTEAALRKNRNGDDGNKGRHAPIKNRQVEKVAQNNHFLALFVFAVFFPSAFLVLWCT
jgi:hypothetical protein